MRCYRFISDFDLRQDSLSIFDKEILNQVKNVLRLKSGSQIMLADGRANEALAEITEFGGDYLRVKLLQKEVNDKESGRKVILYCSILKRENFELVVQKATEVGVAEIVPLVCERTVKTGFKKERLQKITKEAAEQSGRGIVPILYEPMDFGQAVKQAQQNDRNFLFDLSGEKLLMSDINSLKQKTVGIFIGPEGGWSNFEMDLTRQREFKIVSLGKLTLRAETAAVVATYLACNNL
jgi:16S rRNA (uracil1498-N3)-methyltransferase